MPFPIVRWVLVGVAFASSGYYLVANVYPILASVRAAFSSLFLPIYQFMHQAEAKSMRLIIIIVAALHAGLALSFKVLFFNYYVVKAKDTVPL